MNRKPLRAAIYTRKSTEEGLDQEFNSLDAQRDACEAFTVSQKELGWELVADRYDDGGLSGGTMDRPALQRLLAEINARRVDVVIVYKIDRLTRSLMDFARIVEIFENNDVSFVSVTQQFNTSTSMGRLSLNMLLSFAQFEREVTAERIRDKVAASKKKGIWMGGPVPLGYDAIERKLVINPEEADVVRWLFDTYRKTNSVRVLKELADKRGIVSKRRINPLGKQRGGVPLSRGLLYRLLSNPIYKGCIRHGERLYPGRHDAIIAKQTFDMVQAQLEKNASNRKFAANTKQSHLLTGLLFDHTGDRMSPTHTNKKGERYNYYISHRLMQARCQDHDSWRLPARPIDELVLNTIIEQLQNGPKLIDELGLTHETPNLVGFTVEVAARNASQLADGNNNFINESLKFLINRINLHLDSIIIEIDRIRLAQWLGNKDHKEELASLGEWVIRLPVQLKRRGVETKLTIKGKHSVDKADDCLVKLIARAHYLLTELTDGKIESISELAKTTGINSSEISRILPLAFLAPDIVQSILDGRQPINMTAQLLKRTNPLPVLWSDQRASLGFSDSR